MAEGDPTINIVGIITLGEDGKLAMMGRRSRDPKLPAGVDTFTSIGGGWKKDKETMIEASVREVTEEAGVTPRPEEIHHVETYRVTLEENGREAFLHLMFYDAHKAGTATLIESKERREDGSLVPMKWVDETEYLLMAAKSVAATRGEVFPGDRLLLPNQEAVTDAIQKLKERNLFPKNLFNVTPTVFEDPAKVVAELQPVIDARTAAPAAADEPLVLPQRAAAQKAQQKRGGFSLRSAAIGAVVALAAVGLANLLQSKSVVSAPARDAGIPQTVAAPPAAPPVSHCDAIGLSLDFGDLNDGRATVTEHGNVHTIRWQGMPDGGIAPDARSLRGLPQEVVDLASIAASNRNLLMLEPGRPRGRALIPALQAVAAESRVAICG